MKKSLLFTAALALTAISAVAQQRIVAGLDSIVVYNTDSNGNEVPEFHTVYTHNEAGQVVSILEELTSGLPSTLTEISYKDHNGDGLTDQIQDYFYWDNEWKFNHRIVEIDTNNPMKMLSEDWTKNAETGAWTLEEKTETNITDDGRTTELIQYWRDYETQQLVPGQKQVVTLPYTVFTLMDANPDKPLDMLLHHAQDFLVMERWWFDENGIWQLQRRESRTYDEDGNMITYEAGNYENNQMMYGDKTVRTETENGYRQDNYTCYQGEWSLNDYDIAVRDGNTMTIHRYQSKPDGTEPRVHRCVELYDDNNKVIQSIGFTIMLSQDGFTYIPHSRETYTYNERGLRTGIYCYTKENSEWKLNSKNLYDYDQAGRVTDYIYAYASYGADQGWSYGTRNVTRYTPDGKLILRAEYGLVEEQSIGEEITWKLYQKDIFYYHHDDAQTATTDKVDVTPTGTTAQFTWPTVLGAYTYNLYVYLKDNIFQHFMFDANGHLLSINYAPGRDGATPARHANETPNGWQFTIQDLDLGTEYTYTFTAESENGTQLQTLTGTFQTPEANAINTLTASPTAAPTYNLNGSRVTNAFKGIIIQNGRKVLKK